MNKRHICRFSSPLNGKVRGSRSGGRGRGKNSCLFHGEKTACWWEFSSWCRKGTARIGDEYSFLFAFSRTIFWWWRRRWWKVCVICFFSFSFYLFSCEQRPTHPFAVPKQPGNSGKQNLGKM